MLAPGVRRGGVRVEAAAAQLGLDLDGLAGGQPPAQPVIGRRLEEVQVELLAGGALRVDFGSGRRLAARESHPRQPLRRQVLVLVGADRRPAISAADSSTSSASTSASRS